MPSKVDQSEFKLTIDGGFKIACKRWYGGPRRVLCYPGWLDNSGSFDNLALILAGHGMDVVCVDPPGCGHSDHLPPFSTYHDFEESCMINSILIELKWLDNVVLVAHSRGGGIAVLAAAAFPERFSRLVMIESKTIAVAGVSASAYSSSPAEALRRAHEYSQRGYDRKTRVFSSFEEAVQHNLANPMFPKRNRSTAENIVRRHLKQLPDGTWTFIHDPRIYNQKQKMTISLEGAAQVVRDIRCPVLRIDVDGDANSQMMNIVTGGKKFLEREIQKRKDILQADMAIIPDAGHHVHSDDPEACARIIIPWLNKDLKHIDRSKL